MIKGIGIDIIEKRRFESNISDSDFIGQFIGPNELNEEISNPKNVEFIATRFSIKEAVMKALGSGLNQGYYWHDIEITNNGKVHLKGYFKNLADKMLVKHIHSSCSISKNYIVVLVILEG